MILAGFVILMLVQIGVIIWLYRSWTLLCDLAVMMEVLSRGCPHDEVIDRSTFGHRDVECKRCGAQL